jgi:large subunit ribosomal protein L17
MAGGHANFRGLSRKSSHRQALLRNLVDSLIEHESIQTTWHKAKEAQRLAEKLITLGKKNTEASKRRAMSIFFVSIPNDILKTLQLILMCTNSVHHYLSQSSLDP